MTESMRAFVAARGQRRNVSKGQQAIALAMLFPEADKRGRGNKGETRKFAENANFSLTSLTQARAILAHSPELAATVRDGSANETRFAARWKLGRLLAKVERPERTRSPDGAYVASRDTGFRAYLKEIGLQKDRANECERIAARA